jgi:hypothetical protein
LEEYSLAIRGSLDVGVRLDLLMGSGFPIVADVGAATGDGLGFEVGV